MLSPAELRPLLCAGGFPDAGGITFLVGERDVHLEADLDLVREVLVLCDGRRSVAEIGDAVESGTAADVSDLVAVLHDHGVVVDCAAAWERFDEQSSVRSGLFRPVSDELVHGLMDVPSLPAADPVRRVALDARSTGLASLAAGRRSTTGDADPRAIEFAELSAVLAAAYGKPAGHHRPVPSAGGLYPLLLHVWLTSACGRLEPGVWWYDPSAGVLGLLDAAPSALAALFLQADVKEVLAGRDLPALFISADVARPARKYSNRAYRFALMETGAAMQNAYLACAELGVPIRAVAGFDEPAAGEALRLAPGSVPLLSLLLGS